MKAKLKALCRFLGYWFSYAGRGGFWVGTVWGTCPHCGGRTASRLDLLAVMRIPAKQVTAEEKAEILSKQAVR